MPVITKRLLDAIKPDGKLRILGDDEVSGFGVQVTPAGKISFCITYRIAGKLKRRVIGKFGPMTIDQARKTARIELGRAAGGDDPRPVLASNFETVADLFDAWMTRHVAVHLKPGSARYYRDLYAAQIGRRFGHLAPGALTYTLVAEAFAELKTKGPTANRMIATLRSMLSWAEQQRLIRFKDGNPARGHRRYREAPRLRYLSVDEIRTFITDLPKAPMDDATRRALLLELLLAQRSGEIASMRKGDVDLEAAIWTIPGAVMKSSAAHFVPLPPWSRRIIAEALAEAKGKYVFPSPACDPKAKDAAPIDRHACSKALSRAQRPIGKDATPRARTKTDTWVFDFRDRHGAPAPITPHDLRRTCSSYLELLGYGDVIRGAILDHADSRNVTAKHYSAAELTKLKRTALLHWEAAVRKIMAGDDPFSASVEDDRAEEARKLGVADPDAAPVPTAGIRQRRSA